MQDEAGVARIARDIAAGTPIDWAVAELSCTSDESRSAVRDLRLVARIAAFNHMPMEFVDDDAPDPEEELPRQWGSLTLLERVGRGSYGDVYRAWDARLDRELALKILRREDAAGPEDVGTAVREGRLLARIAHPNVVTVHGADIIDDEVGIWMEFIHGRPLDAWVRDCGPLDPQEAAAIGVAVARALAAMHEAGLVHGDVKAQNVMRRDDARIVLMDLGASQLVAGPSRGVRGTPMYTAPEILDGSPASAQSDIYALGVLLFFLVTGRYPVEAGNLAELLRRHRLDPAVPVRSLRPEVPPRLARIIGRAIAPDPRARFSNAKALETALEQLESAASFQRWSWIAAGLTAVVIVVAAVWFWMPKPSSPAATWLLIVPFDNSTGARELDDVISYELARSLADSRTIGVVPADRVDDTLRLMRRAPGTVLDVRLGREVCLRDGGIAALVSGRIERSGAEFVIQADVVSPTTGAIIVSARESARTEGDLLGAIRREALDIRQSMGDSRKAVDAGRQELERVTTSSLRALQKYSQAAALTRTPGIWLNGPGTLQGATIEGYLREALSDDPRFASAHTLLAWTLNDLDRPSSEYLPEAETALTLADGLPDGERHLIEATVHNLRARATHDSTVRRFEFGASAALYEMVLGEQPNNYLAAANLSSIYRTLERTNQLNDVLERLARMRPNAFDLNARTAMTLALGGDAARATPYAERALVALSALHGTGNSEELAVNAPYAAFVRMFPAYAAWQAGRLSEVLAVADSAIRDLSSMGRSEQAAVAARAAEMYATLGRFRRARDVAALIPDTATRERTEVHLLWAAGDTPGVISAIEAIRGPKTAFDAVAGMMIDAGMLDRAHALLAETRAGMTRTGVINDLAGRRYLAAFETRLASKEGRDADAVKAGEEFMSGLPPGPRPMYELLTADHLARSLARTRDVSRAVTVLETFTAYPADMGIGEGYAWLRLRLSLADVYRSSGRQREAQIILSDLVQLLALADADATLLAEVNRRIPAGH